MDGIITPIGDPLRSEGREESGIQALKSPDDLDGTPGVSNRTSCRMDEAPCSRKGPVHTERVRGWVLEWTACFATALLALYLLEASMGS